MKHNRLQHTADILCKMFCGWRLINSYAELVQLGSGILRIDAISGNCLFNDAQVAELNIAGELKVWLQGDLKAHNIQISDLRKAELVATLELDQKRDRERPTEVFHLDQQGKPVTKGNFYSLKIHCVSDVVTDEKTYHSSFDDLEEWPIDWPSA